MELSFFRTQSNTTQGTWNQFNDEHTMTPSDRGIRYVERAARSGALAQTRERNPRPRIASARSGCESGIAPRGSTTNSSRAGRKMGQMPRA
jgi:hypothetical protein